MASASLLVVDATRQPTNTVRGVTSGNEFIEGPAAAPLRRDPRFLGVAARLGLLAYWRGGRLPDFCGPLHPEPICTNLRVR